MDFQKLAEESNDRRDNLRWSVNSFLGANATLWEASPIEAEVNKRQQQCWTGALVNISYDGARITLPKACKDRFHEHQIVRMQLLVNLEDMKVDSSAQIKSIKQNSRNTALRFGMEFLDLEDNPQAKVAVRRICKLVEKFQPVNII